MKRHPLETIIGGIVIVIAIGFLVFSSSVFRIDTDEGYTLQASFLKVGGVQPGTPIRVSGVQVGTVKELSLNKDTFEAEVLMEINREVILPEDTTAAIVGDGLLGGKYVDLRPGSSDLFLKSNSKISKTIDFQSLEDLVGDIIFSVTN